MLDSINITEGGMLRQTAVGTGWGIGMWDGWVDAWYWKMSRFAMLGLGLS